jgi:hypothetical protein
MAQKKIIQDILPSKRRSIRDVTLDKESPKKSSESSAANRADRGIRVPIHLEHKAEVKRSDAKRDIYSSSTSTSSSTLPKKPRVEKKKKTIRNRKWFLGGIIIVCCLIVVYASSIFLARAKVSITLKSENVPISGTYSAAESAESPNLSFETISTTTMAHVSVSASAQGTVNAYATGMAILINASSPSTQIITAGTHLEDGRGLIYKTVSSVVIPAATSKSAGTVAVKIIADAPGPSYNSSLTSLKGDLSIVAWQWTAKAKIFYGRMTSNMTGGSSGPKMTVGSAILSATAATLSSSLSLSAPQVLESIVPTGYILYPKASNIILSSTTVTSTGSTTADVSMSALVTGIIFNKSDLENTLAKNQIAQFPADNYEVNGLDSLVFAPINGQTFSMATTSIKFTLTGALNIVGLIDTSTIKSQLEGKPLSASNSVFSQYSSVISGAQVSIVPFWIRTIPSSPKRISVVVSTSTN